MQDAVALLGIEMPYVLKCYKTHYVLKYYNENKQLLGIDLTKPSQMLEGVISVP